jgi:ubiquinone/menaquinone biosynthesis C-methylase UbiE
MNWVDYWNGKPTIYVSRRHQEAHDTDIAESLVRFIGHPDARVLDFGCGDATGADFVANRCAKLYLWDAAESVRNRLSERYAANATISVLSPDALSALEPNSIDLITIVSVVQYLEPNTLAQIFTDCRRLLSWRGKLVIADVIPPDIGIVHDTWQLMRFAYDEGFASAAALGLAKTAMSDYMSLRSKLSLKKYSAADFVSMLAAHGFEAQQLDKNIGHNQLRKAYVAKPIANTAIPTERRTETFLQHLA